MTETSGRILLPLLALPIALLALTQPSGRAWAEPLTACGDQNADLKQGTLNLPELKKIITGCAEFGKQNPDNPYVYYNIAMAFESGGNRNEAIAFYSKAIELKPDFVRALNYRGNIYNLNQDEARALADQTAAISIDPKDFRSWRSRYDANYNMKNYRPAINDITKAIELSPQEDFLLYYNRGQTYEKLGDTAAAGADYKKADSILTYPFPPLENAMKGLGLQPTAR